jgi:hypothetical protein
MLVANVWMVQNADKTVDPLAVSGTRRSAIVNWLILQGVVITPAMDDEQVEKLWGEHQSGAQVHSVRVN